jgi:DnaJ-class molecular chaperone
MRKPAIIIVRAAVTFAAVLGFVPLSAAGAARHDCAGHSAATTAAVAAAKNAIPKCQQCGAYKENPGFVDGRCYKCSGSGVEHKSITASQTCPDCKGKGKKTGFGLSVKCKKCDGSGSLGIYVKETKQIKCTECLGKGTKKLRCTSAFHGGGPTNLSGKQ